MSINVHNTPVECFEYTVATPLTTTPLSRPLERGRPYVNTQYLLFHKRDHPGIHIAATIELLQNC